MAAVTLKARLFDIQQSLKCAANMGGLREQVLVSVNSLGEIIDALEESEHVDPCPPELLERVDEYFAAKGISHGAKLRVELRSYIPRYKKKERTTND